MTYPNSQLLFGQLQWMTALTLVQMTSLPTELLIQVVYLW